MLKIKIIYRIVLIAVGFVAAFGLIGAGMRSNSAVEQETLLITHVAPRTFDVQISAIGDLEANRSRAIFSTIRGDNAKLIYIVPEGSRVNTGDTVIKLDSAPFEEAISTLQEKLRSKESNLETQKKGLEWEKEQIHHDLKAADYEIETAELELSRIINGDGPQEIAKLQSTMQKAQAKYEELEGYMEDLYLLEKDGYINPSESKQAKLKLDEERAAYENAKLQYESYTQYIHPMQIKKAETALRRAQNKKEESIKSGAFRLTKETASFNLANHELNDLKNNLQNARNDLVMTDIKAPTPGMVVHKEEFRGGQRRKPRVGDVLIKNQIVLDLPDLDSMIVKTRVREVDLCKVQIGQPVSIKVDAYPNLILDGTVDSIGVLALTDVMHMGEEKYFEAKIALQTKDANLRPGMTARLVIHCAHVDNAPSVPIHAIFEHAKEPYCYVLENNTFKVTPIKVGQSNNDWAEITSGVTDGQIVSLVHPSDMKIIDPQNLLGKNHGSQSSTSNTN